LKSLEFREMVHVCRSSSRFRLTSSRVGPLRLRRPALTSPGPTAPARIDAPNNSLREIAISKTTFHFDWFCSAMATRCCLVRKIRVPRVTAGVAMQVSFILLTSSSLNSRPACTTYTLPLSAVK
jgi:hypothetical protein